MKPLSRLILTFLAGYCDTVTFVHMKGIFSAHVTGNFVLFAAALDRGLQSADYLKLVTFPVFIAGVALATFIYVRAEGKPKTSGLVRILGLMTLILWGCTAASIFAPIAPFASREPFAAIDITITMTVVVAMAMQNALHHFIPGAMTTVMTGTVMNTVARLTKKTLGVKPVTAEKPADINTLWLILLFAAGCILAAIAVRWMGFSSLVVAAGLTLILFLTERAALKARTAIV